MKILFISVFAEKTGWGTAANKIAEALDSNPEIDLVCRTVFLGTKDLWNDTVIKCHKKSSLDCDYCIQLLLPHHMEYSNTFKKCIGMFFNETDNYKYSSWSSILNLMDEVWVPYPSNAHKNSGVISPIRVIEQPHQILDYNSFTPLELPTDGDFVFYTIGELNKRKNISCLIKAFYTEFGQQENVRLVIKASEPGSKPNNTAQKIIDIGKAIKNGLKVTNRYQPEIIITNHLSEEELIGLHKACDCFVSTSCGEAVCLPLLDAISIGNDFIAPLSYGTGHILNTIEAANKGIECFPEDVFGVNDTFGDLFTSYEQWMNPSIISLRQKMRYSYNEWKNNNYSKSVIKSLTYKEKLNKHFSYQTISDTVIRSLQGDNTNIYNS